MPVGLETLAPPTPHAPKLPDPLGRPRSDTGATQPRALLVAADGTRASSAALRIAAELSARDGVPLEAVVVEPPMLADVKGITLGANVLRQEAGEFGERLERVRRQLCETLSGDQWRLHVEFGRAAATIAHTSAELDARLVVMGLSNHHPSRRAFSEPRAARVIRYCETPVLAVESRARAVPRCVVVGMDFGDASRRAAKAALELVGRGGRLVLVHVHPPHLEQIAPDGRWAVYEVGVKDAFRQLEAQFGGEGVTVTSKVIAGRVTEVLLREAEREGADAIAVGSHGPRLIQRMLIGSVPLQLLYASDRSVLLAPPPRTGNRP